MMRHTLVKVGRTNTTYFKAGASDYKGRLSNYARIEVLTVRKQHNPGQPSCHQRQEIVKKHSQALADSAPETASTYWIALDERGKQTTSENLAKFIDLRASRGHSHMVWFIGGPLGLSDEFLSRCRLSLSLSRMTFPHEMVPMILLEQIYRAHKISAGEPYHR